MENNLNVHQQQKNKQEYNYTTEYNMALKKKNH